MSAITWREPAKDGEWFEVGRRHFIACCNCDLVHELRFERRKGNLFMSARRDLKATEERRKRPRRNRDYGERIEE